MPSGQHAFVRAVACEVPGRSSPSSFTDSKGLLVPRTPRSRLLLWLKEQERVQAICSKITLEVYLLRHSSSGGLAAEDGLSYARAR